MGTGREGAVEKGQAGLRRSQLKMQVCGAWVFWSRGLREGSATRREEEEAGWCPGIGFLLIADRKMGSFRMWQHPRGYVSNFLVRLASS